MTQKIEWGIAAQTLLDNPVFKATLDRLDAEYHARWRAAKDVAAREDCHRYVKIIERISEDLNSIALSGQLEKARQKELEGKKSWLMK